MSDPISQFLEEIIQLLLKEAQAAVEAAQNLAELEQVEKRYLGRNKGLNSLRRLIGTLPKEQRPLVGARLNEAVETLTALVQARHSRLIKLMLSESDPMRELRIRNQLWLESAAHLRRELSKTKTLDVTLPGRALPFGRLHPLTQTAELIRETLIGMGYEFVEGPELEDYQYNFAVLNYPEDHPAMDEQNSFFITETKLLRTQTTAIQGRVMERRSPPFRIATIGRCFRYEAVDATHHHTFHQVDVFMVDEGISMADLKGTLGTFARAMFGPNTQVRFRPDFFPFVEPGVDYAISWRMPDGNVRWLEIGGAGMIHPNILRRYGIDTERYTGFAFGLGVERIHMLRTGVDDLRLYLENDLRFLQQF
ncbi:phenylalanyl-tRNA synthetase, alpha subunit [Chthonomonas calidirosea]|uniref:Phenylalanine--tRNA ligase alpha subunit n=1 Tax=Chthonomonas calidirosea (strain DSM 23976 / ICMP 18418 / T49) TaxID=1303518 RepID=S0ETB8_CHTCT|nr:phenylalanine--tRNA ligase subunit alpha [Chthonomonas calidirosea]CCW34713.1 phenylalanyl-tRNA synthetase, alpha subunit [Chthonomonas calidirosea T49]CEK14003.1 phenylalanyl-tRNA synthetase, alpha subunit [Chthonomonas calidirosea]